VWRSDAVFGYKCRVSDTGAPSKRNSGASSENSFQHWEQWNTSFRRHPSIPCILADLERQGAYVNHLLSNLYLVPQVIDRVNERPKMKERAAALAKAKRLVNTAHSLLVEVGGEGKKPTETRLWLSIARKQLGEQILALKKDGSARSWDSTDYAICAVCAYLHRFLPRGVYPPAAALIDAAGIPGDFPNGGCWDEDSVKKRNSRFRKNYPAIAQYIENKERAVAPPEPQLDTLPLMRISFARAFAKALNKG
jgi:hypothetical protein